MAILFSTNLNINGLDYEYHLISYTGAYTSFLINQSVQGITVVTPAPGGPTVSIGASYKGMKAISLLSGGSYSSDGTVAVMCLMGAGGSSGVQSSPVRVLMCGNSVTAGTVSGTPTGTEYGMVQVAQDELGDDWNLINCGGGGTSMRDWARPIVPEVPVAAIGGAYEILAEPNLPADLAVIELGGNDAASFFEDGAPTESEYEDALTTLIDKLFADKVSRILVSTTIPNPGYPAGTEVGDRLVTYTRAIETVCAATDKVVLCSTDFMEALDPSLNFFENNVHPNASGHRIMGEAFATDLRKLVEN
jgi:lysophospholipase L1-like esterase